MIEQKPSTIEEAPSLADITSSSSERVGKVDFTARLAGQGAAEDDEHEQGDSSVIALTSMARPMRPADDVEPEDDAPRMPFILPPAKVDAAMALEAERTRHEIAAARGELPEEEPELEDDELEDGTDADQHGDQDDEAPAEHVARPHPLAKLVRRGASEEPSATEHAAPGDDVEPAVDVEHPEPVGAEQAPVSSGPPEGLIIQDVADFEKVAAEETARAARAQAEEDERRALAEQARAEAERLALEEQARIEAEAAAAQEAALLAAAAEVERQAREAEARTAAAHPAAAPVPAEPADELADEPDLVDEARHDGPVHSVAEVADAVIAAMHSINEAHERHVEAIELETARRCELLTAQAELDAELIRLHARREAHAIISAARMRSGEPEAGQVETDQLGEIGETFSRFAETIETTVAFSPESPDHFRKP